MPSRHLRCEGDAHMTLGKMMMIHTTQPGNLFRSMNDEQKIYYSKYSGRSRRRRKVYSRKGILVVAIKPILLMAKGLPMLWGLISIL